jgi:hypothetical protein
LLLLAVGLGAYVYYVERPAQEREAAKKTLLTVDRDTVTGVTLTYPERELRIEKDAGGQWRLTAPVDTAADQQTVKNLIDAIVDAELSKTIDDPGDDLAPYGLDTPTVTIRLQLKDGGAVSPMMVGKQTPIGFKAYVRKEGDPKLYLTTGAFHSGVKKEVKDLRDKTIIDFDDGAVRAITLSKRGTPPIELKRTDDTWSITAPAAFPADPAEVRSLLSSLRGLRAQDFVDTPTADDLAKYDLADPALAVALVVGADEARKSVRFGGEAPGTPKQNYAKREDGDTVYLVGDWTLRSLDKNVASLRDKTVLPFAPADVTALTITRKNETPLVLTRTDTGAWTIPGAETKHVDTEAVTQLLDDLHDTKPHEIASDNVTDPSPYGLDAPDLHVSVAGKDGAPLGALRASRRGPAPGAEAPNDTGAVTERFYFTRDGSETVYEGRAYLFTRLLKGEADLLVADDAKNEDPGDDEAPAEDHGHDDVDSPE